MNPGPHVLFLNGRLQTKALMEAGLGEQAFTSSWLVLNRRAAPLGSRVHIVPYPRRSDYIAAGTRFAAIERADPWIQYYGGNADHYHYYYQSIAKLLREIRPDLVIGGMAQFHELLCIDACREFGILYISPVSAGDASGRFFCHRWNSPETIGGCEDIPERNEVAGYIHRHASGAIRTGELNAARTAAWQSRPPRRILGEPFCSPSLVEMLAIERRNQSNLERWNAASKTVSFPTTPHKKLKILFPLQLQPEATMDVWGAAYRDQAALLRRLATAAGDQATIFLRPDPNANCELTASLLEAVCQHPALVPLSSRVPMQDAFARADLVLTVTGTIALQAILTRKPCATLVPSRNNSVLGCRYISSPEKLAALLYEIQCAQFPMHGDEELFRFVERFFAESYEGVIHQVRTHPQAFYIENDKRLVMAFSRLVTQVASPSNSTPLRVRQESQPVYQERKA